MLHQYNVLFYILENIFFSHDHLPKIVTLNVSPLTCLEYLHSFHSNPFLTHRQKIRINIIRNNYAKENQSTYKNQFIPTDLFMTYIFLPNLVLKCFVGE